MLRHVLSRLPVVLTLAALLLAAGAAAGQESSKGDKPLAIDAAQRAKVIGQVLQELDDRYVFPETAAKMRKAIEARVEHKEYDAVTTGQELARLLTAHLQEVSKDKHLRISCSTSPLPKPPGKEGGPSPEEIQKMRATQQYRNSGFVKLERLTGNVGYLELRGFNNPDEAGPTLAAAMNFLANTDALIIDLRQNGGGSPKMVQLVCSYFLDEQPVHLNSLYWRK